jgi:hypothetical protein
MISLKQRQENLQGNAVLKKRRNMDAMGRQEKGPLKNP